MAKTAFEQANGEQKTVGHTVLKANKAKVEQGHEQTDGARQNHLPLASAPPSDTPASTMNGCPSNTAGFSLYVATYRGCISFIMPSLSFKERTPSNKVEHDRNSEKSQSVRCVRVHFHPADEPPIRHVFPQVRLAPRCHGSALSRRVESTRSTVKPKMVTNRGKFVENTPARASSNPSARAAFQPHCTLYTWRELQRKGHQKHDSVHRSREKKPARRTHNISQPRVYLLPHGDKTV